MLVALDDVSVTNNTIKMLYNPHYHIEGAGKQAWRVDFLYVWRVTPHLPDEEEIYMDPENRDKDGVLDMLKIWRAKGIPFPRNWSKPKYYHK